MKILVTLLALTTTLGTMTLQAQDATSLTTNVLQREGTFYSTYDVAGKVYYQGQWYENPYASQEELFAAIGLNPDGTPIDGVTDYPELYAGYNSLEEAIADWGFNSVEEMLAEWNPGRTLDETYEDWYGTPPPMVGTYNMEEILSDPAKTAAFLAAIPNIPPGTMNNIIEMTAFDPNTTVAIAAQLNAAENPANYASAFGDFLIQATDPNGSLYGVRSQIDFTNADMGNFDPAGKDFSTIQIAASQLNSPGMNDFSLTIQSVNFTGSNLSGMDLTGFNPVNRGMMPLAGGPWFLGGNFNGTNFTNAQNLNIAVLANASVLHNVILTGTGITRGALETALLASGRDNTTVTNILNTITF